MTVKVTCVYDEGAKENTSLIGARGTAMLAEAGGRRVLFDTGLRARYLAHNLDCLGVDVQSIDAVVVSQDRPDNARGLEGVLKGRASPVAVYAPPGSYSGKGGLASRSSGISDSARPMADLVFEEGWVEVLPGIHRTPFLESGKGYRESFLVLEGPKGPAVLSGFGSGGPEAVLVETEARFKRKAHAFLGSVALEKAKKPVAEAYADSFMAHGVVDIRLNHSTGRNGITNVRVKLGLSAVKDFYVGDVYEA